MKIQLYIKSLFFFLLFANSIESVGQVLQSSNLPIMVINSQEEIVDEPKREATVQIFYNSDGNRNSITDDPHYEGLLGIELRGQTSLFLFDKKSFGIEFRDGQGEDLNVSVMGFPEESDFVLHSPFSDKSLMRNALSYTLAARIMDYAPRTQFCELILNGAYYGVVVFTEKIKRDKNRVAVSKLRTEDVEGDQLTGGYIFKFDKGDGDEVIYTSPFASFPAAWQRTNFLIHYPKPENLTTEQRQYASNYLSELDQLFHSEEYLDSVDGYRNLIDVNSFIDQIIINEITRNVDAYRLSTYMYKDRDSVNHLLKMGPVWDFNLAFGNANYCNGLSIAGWAYNFNKVCFDDAWLNHFWWEKLIDDEWFAERLIDRYENLRTDLLSDEEVCGLIDDFQSQLSEAQSRNFQRWPILGTWIWPNNFIGNSFNEEVEFLKDWALRRLEWMDNNISFLVSPDVSSGMDVVVYPNPTFDFINLVLPDSRNYFNLELVLYNSLGQQLELYKLNGPYHLIDLRDRHLKGLIYYKLIDGDKVLASGSFINMDD